MSDRIEPDASYLQLLQALLEAQNLFPVVKEGEENPFFSKGDKKAKYASLRAIWAAIRPGLYKTKLVVTQAISIGENERNILTTRVSHVGGYFIESKSILPTKDPSDPQKLGSSITYLRRYQLTSLLGIVTGEGEDDGNSASGNEYPPPPNQKKTFQNKNTKPIEKPTVGAVKPPTAEPVEKPNVNPNLVTKDQLTRLHAIASELGWKKEESAALLLKFGYTSSKDILKNDYQKIIRAIENPS